ncbi:HAD family hydrolase [Leekyejoonella antrihumi]|uniref:HAD family hydrolase n=1 Tax=Leekyejoonella antrihumi TaxID=1660198 RepID=A0A563DYU7_9MICO|nr:HAD-IA family hydrolase [Leekyejoonella antrihumi]TWP34834.1 HAD family hydrolase [Leekyejoonella antrihumi]
MTAALPGDLGDLTEDLPDDLTPSPVDVVVFDLGNVLIRWDPAPAISAAVGEERAARFLADDSFDFGGWNHQQDAGRSWAAGEAAALATHPHYEQEILAYRQHFDASMTGAIEGTIEILRELHTAHVHLVALTNWSAEMFPFALKRFDFLGLFEDIIVSGEEGVAKPDPEIFEVLEERIHHLGSLDDSIFIDDSPANVQAAMEAGLDAIPFVSAADLRSDLLVRGLPLQDA